MTRCILTVTRRQLIGSGIGLGVASCYARFGSAAAAPALLASQQDKSLSIALLDRHWDVLEAPVETYAEASGIEIEASLYEYDELYSQLSLALTQRADTFDVVFLADPWVPQFASFLLPLDTPPELLDVCAPVAVEVGSYPPGKQLSALPWLGETQFFALRPQWLERSGQTPPETWDATVEAATTLSGQLDPDDELAAFAIRTLDGHEMVESFLPILRGYGKSLIDPETNIPQLDTPEGLAAMESFLTLATLSPVESPAVDAPTNADRFEAGEIGMMSSFWASDLLTSRSVESLPDAGPIATTLQPGQPGIDRLAMSGIWLAGIPTGSLQPEVARDFLDWIVSLELQSQLPGLSLPPVRVDVLSDTPLVNRFPDLPVLKEMLFAATPRPRSPFYPQLERLLATELQQALDGTVSGADALKNANIALREFLVREGVLAD